MKKGQYYFIVRSDSKTSYFCCDNLDLINFWTREIHAAKAFHEWYKNLQNLRYNSEIQRKFPQNIVKYDFIIDSLISVNFPECDLD